jgi:hypothetical protein
MLDVGTGIAALASIRRGDVSDLAAVDALL